MADVYDLVVVGAGPGGYIAAIRAAQLGFKVACIDKRAGKALGGTCLNVGCIPSKALLDSSELYDLAKHKFTKHGIQVGGVTLDLPTMMKRKDDVVKSLTGGIAGLFKKYKVTPLYGAARFRSASELEIRGEDGSVTAVTAKQILIATGSESIELPFLKYDHKYVVDSTGALAFDSVPKHMIVVGGGYIGLELGSVWQRLGSKVTVVEFLPRILPISDGEIASTVQRLLSRQGMEFHLGTKVTGAVVQGNKVVVSAAREGEKLSFEGDRVLVAVGRRANTTGLGLAEIGVTVDAKTGKIPVNARFQTNVPGVSALGDVIEGPMLAHKAMEEGVAFAEMLPRPGDTKSRPDAHLNYDCIPSAIYIWPEVASVGQHEEQLKASGREYKVGKFPFVASGRARAMDETDGYVKILTDAKTDRVLGVHILGPRASDLIAECVAIMEYRGSAEDIARMVHGHPTLTESVAEAARAAWLGMPLHA